MLWNISQHNPATREYAPLGRVRADNHPRAVLTALKKWRIKDVRDQRRIVAEPVRNSLARPNKITPLSDDDLTQARAWVSALNTVLRD